MTTQLVINSWMMSVGYPLISVLRLMLCIYGIARTRFQVSFWLWSIAAFLSLGVSLFASIQQRLITGVIGFPSISYLWPVAAVADMASLALNLVGLLLLVRAASTKSNDTQYA